MPDYRDAVTTCPVDLPRPALLGMVRLVRVLYRLSRNPAYRELVFPCVPETARFDPGHDSVMMGYDFHLENGRPRLIEVNTNAGGAVLAYLAHHPTAAEARKALTPRVRREFLAAFAEELRLFSQGKCERPREVAIVDEEPEKQFLYGEMLAFADMFREWGTAVTIADPGQLEAGPEGAFAAGRPVDLIYNRHCDFYLESAAMAGIRAAYLAGSVCLTPNPFTYGLLADKRRLPLWSDPGILAALGARAEEIAFLGETIPESRLMADIPREALWQERSRWVFKPVSRFGSRGVLLGGKISRARFDALDPLDTLAQRFVPPSVTPACGDRPAMKSDFRLFVYRTRILGITARLYQGQVTNLRTPGGGFAPVRLLQG